MKFSMIQLFWEKLLGRLYSFSLRNRKNVEIRGKVRIKGSPIIDIHDECKLIIEDDVLLNSCNLGYHINMHSPVKLFADRPGAVIKIGEKSRIHGTCVHAYEGIYIGKNCLIAANTQIFDGNGHDLSFPNVADRINTSGNASPIHIEDNVWIGANSFVLPGVRIGDGAVIAACSVVSKNIPPKAIAGGNPAKVLKQF